MTEAKLYEQARQIAQRVMGWTLGKSPLSRSPYYWPPEQGGERGPGIMVENYRPWENETQAWGIVDRLVSIGWLVTIKTMPKGAPFWLTNDPVAEPNARLYARAACELYWVRKEEPPTGHGWHSYPRFTPGDSRPMAIFLAAVKVAEGGGRYAGEEKASD